MKNLLTTAAVATMLIIGVSANAIPTLVVSDNAGNTSGTISSNPSGKAQYAGTLGNWDVGVAIGNASPPGSGFSASAPYLDLNVVASWALNVETPGKTLTTSFVVDNLGPISTVNFQPQGNWVGMTSETYTVKVNGVAIYNQTFTSSPASGNVYLPTTIAAGSTVEIDAVVLASGTGTDKTSFDLQLFGVPDSGTTLAMLGSALTGLALFARRRKVA